MARSKNNKKMNGGGDDWNFLSWVYTKGEEVKKDGTPLSNETASPEVIKSEEQNGLPPVVADKSLKNGWGLFGGKSKKIKKRKANKTKKSKK